MGNEALPVNRRKRVALGCLGALLLMALTCFVSARRFFIPQHLNVVSIRTTPEFQNAALMERAWQLPVAATYRRVLMFQPNGSVCGPTTVADAMRSLGTPHETPAEVLAGTGHCPLGVCIPGLTLDELAGIARMKTRRPVTVLRDLTQAQFRDELTHANDPARRYLLNFDRGPLFGTVGGHHSPIGGYLAAEDLVLVLDVNARYRPWLVRSERLYAAMNTVDPSTGRKRGMLRIE